MLTVFCSAKGSPGATTAAMALWNAWPGRVVLVGADAGGDDLRAIFASVRPQEGLLRATVDRGDLPDLVWREMLALDPGVRHRLLLFGIERPSQARSMVPLWEPLGRYLRSLAVDDIDVLVDASRVAAVEHPPLGLLRNADRVVVCARSTVPAMVAAAALVETLDDLGVPRRAVRILIVGRQKWPGREIEAQGSVGVPVIGTLPWDPKAVRAMGEQLVARKARGALAGAARAVAGDLIADWRRDLLEESTELEEVVSADVLDR